MIVRTDISGDARVDREARTLANNGYKVHIINVGSKNNKELPQNVPYAINKVFGKGSPGKNYFKVLLSYIIFIFHSLVLAFKAKADVYHAHDLYAVIPAYLAARIGKAKYIFDAHELWEEKRRHWFKELQKSIELRFAKKADAIITVNEERSIIIEKELNLNKKPVVLRNVPLFNPANKTDLLQKFIAKKGLVNKKIILYQGIIKPGRAYEKIINSAKLLNSEAVIVFLGNAYSDDYLNNLKELNASVASDKVFFHPFVQKEKLLSFTASADIGLVLYENIGRNSYFCASNKLYEYMLCGIPVIASRFPTLRIVEENNIGICVDPVNPVEISEAINKLVEEKVLYNKFSENARILAIGQYNWNLESNKLIDAYKELLKA
jgi:glycosyltransferase involved in cell wall biosynthesis